MTAPGIVFNFVLKVREEALRSRDAGTQILNNIIKGNQAAQYGGGIAGGGTITGNTIIGNYCDFLRRWVF